MNFLSKWGAKLLAALAVVATIFGGLKLYGRGKKREGASEERERAEKKAREAAEKRNEIDTDVARTPDAELDERLSRWQRRNK